MLTCLALTNPETENLATKAKEVMGMNADEAKQEMQHAAREGSEMASDMQAKAKGTVIFSIRTP